MRPDLTLDEIIDQCLAQGFDIDQISRILLHEEREDWKQELAETIKRIRIKRSGVNITTRKMGRANPQRSMRAKQTARRFKSKRKLAAKRFARSPKGKQMRRVMKQIRGPARPKARPKMRRPSRPKMRRPRAGARPRTARRRRR